MKLRIRGDTLRLRLSQSEVAALAAKGQVLDAIHFGPDPAARLGYALISDPAAPRVAATLTAGSIEVRLPAGDARAWAVSDDVSLSAEQPLSDGRVLAVLIEKDFQCLVPREGESDSDAFPNPAR